MIFLKPFLSSSSRYYIEKLKPCGLVYLLMITPTVLLYLINIASLNCCFHVSWVPWRRYYRIAVPNASGFLPHPRRKFTPILYQFLFLFRTKPRRCSLTRVMLDAIINIIRIKENPIKYVRL